VDTGNPALAIDCPHCGLLTARISQYCRNCGYSLWPSAPVASAAFRAWRDASPERTLAHQYDLTLPERPPYVPAVPLMDYEERARQLGIHLFPTSNYPILICIGLFFLALAAPPWNMWVRIVCGAIGLLFFLIGVVGWVVIEDTKMYTESVGGVHVQPETEDHH